MNVHFYICIQKLHFTISYVKMTMALYCIQPAMTKLRVDMLPPAGYYKPVVPNTYIGKQRALGSLHKS